MSTISFKKGLFLPHLKFTRDNNIEKLADPKTAVIYLQQHIGKICKPTVKPGDIVKIGQKIGESDGFVSAPVHSSISGKVVKIEERPCPLGKKVLAVVIENDGKDTEGFNEREDIDKTGKEELLNMVKEAGIVGLGGATFPTHVKLSPTKDKKVDTIILNGAECEPYITCDHRLMLEHTREIVKGLKAIMKVTGVTKAFICVEDNKKDAIEVIRKEIINEKNVKVVTLKSKYPQGAEKIIIKAVLDRTVPIGCLPMDVGVIVNNVGTAKAVYDAVYLRKPLIERVVTVTGDVKKPKNLLVKIGTPVKDLINECGGYKGKPKKIIMGGPMMGLALSSDNVAVMKGTTNILVMKNPEEPAERECIRCARCIDACPMNLMPNMIVRLIKAGKVKEAENHHAMACFECGACAYVCPSKIPLVKWIKHAKDKICENGKK